MPWLIQMMGCAVTFIGLVLVIWLGFWVLILLGFLSLGYALWRYLVRKGIMNPYPGVPMTEVIIEDETTTTVIEGDYKKLDEEKQP